MHLTVDDRERDVSPFLTRLIVSTTFTMEIQRQIIGDFSIWKNGFPLFIIERKTWQDLSSSISDGRRENHESLVLFREKYPSCRIAYIIEGSSSRYNKTNRYGIPLLNLENYLMSLEYRTSCSIWYSANLKNTAEVLLDKMFRLKNIEIAFMKFSLEEPPSGGNNTEILNEDLMNKNSMDKMAVQSFACFPSIGKTTATAIVNSGISLKMAFDGVNVEELMQISKTKATTLNKIFATFFASPVDENLIAQCKGISPGLAKKISRTFTYRQLFESPQVLGPKMSQSRVVSKRLYTLLNFQKSEEEETASSPPTISSDTSASSEGGSAGGACAEVASNGN